MKQKIKTYRYFIALGLIASLVLLSYCGGNRGTLTIVNTTLKSVNIIFGEKDVALQSEQHYTQKGLKPGKHFIKIGKDSLVKVEIKKKKTTVVDISGDACFVVADYTNQYDEDADGNVKVVEKFMNKDTFTTSEKLSADLGEQLPELIQHNENITRLHRVDCSWIDNDQAIIDAIANLP